jgi:hypothetical protein
LRTENITTRINPNVCVTQLYLPWFTSFQKDYPLLHSFSGQEVIECIPLYRVQQRPLAPTDIRIVKIEGEGDLIHCIFDYGRDIKIKESGCFGGDATGATFGTRQFLFFHKQHSYAFPC